MSKKITYNYIECGCCGYYHPADWWGECRDNEHRLTFDQLPDDAKIFTIEDQMDEDTFEKFIDKQLKEERRNKK